MPPTRAQLLSTAKSFVDSFNKWTIPDILSIRTPSCIHRIYPASELRPARNNAEFAKFVEGLMQVFKEFRFTIINEDDTLVDTEARKVFLRLRGYSDTEIGPFDSEVLFVLKITEDGEKVEDVMEFVDTETGLSFMRKRQALAG